MNVKKVCQMFRVYDQGGQNNNFEALNKLIGDGWVPVRESGVTGNDKLPGVFWLVTLEREVLEAAEIIEEQPVQEPGLVELLQRAIDHIKGKQCEDGAVLDEDDFLSELRKMDDYI